MEKEIRVFAITKQNVLSLTKIVQIIAFTYNSMLYVDYLELIVISRISIGNSILNHLDNVIIHSFTLSRNACCQSGPFSRQSRFCVFKIPKLVCDGDWLKGFVVIDNNNKNNCNNNNNNNFNNKNIISTTWSYQFSLA